jgi:hypothetical protein
MIRDLPYVLAGDCEIGPGSDSCIGHQYDGRRTVAVPPVRRSGNSLGVCRWGFGATGRCGIFRSAAFFGPSAPAAAALAPPVSCRQTVYAGSWRKSFRPSDVYWVLPSPVNASTVFHVSSMPDGFCCAACALISASDKTGSIDFARSCGQMSCQPAARGRRLGLVLRARFRSSAGTADGRNLIRRRRRALAIRKSGTRGGNAGAWRRSIFSR